MPPTDPLSLAAPVKSAVTGLTRHVVNGQKTTVLSYVTGCVWSPRSSHWAAFTVSVGGAFDRGRLVVWQRHTAERSPSGSF